MSLLSENVIPENHGKVFETNAKEHKELIKIKEVVEKMEGVKDVIIDESVYPKTLTVHTLSIVSVKAIENAVIGTGFHAIPKGLFEL